MDYKTIFHIKFCVFFFFALSSSILAKPPCNYLCADNGGNVIYFCEEKTGPWSCCQNLPQAMKCPTGFQFGPYLYGSINYTKHDLRQFQEIATNNELDRSEYSDWMATHYQQTPIEKLMADFNKVDADGDQKISLAEFVAFRKTEVDSPKAEANIPLIYLFVLSLILLAFFSFAMKIFTKKLSNL